MVHNVASPLARKRISYEDDDPFYLSIHM
jgi:hypothetical protein